MIISAIFIRIVYSNEFVMLIPRMLFHGRLTHLWGILFLAIIAPSGQGVAKNFREYDPAFFSGLSLPDPPSLDVTFTAEGTCSNSPISFFPIVTPAADSLTWSFGDGKSGKGWNPLHIYSQAGSFQVEVTAFLNGETALASGQINITQSDLRLTLVQDTTACVCELPSNAGLCSGITPFEVSVQTQGSVAPQFQWYGPEGMLPGQKTHTLAPETAGYYYVVATDGQCSIYAGVNIKEYNSPDPRGNIWYFGQNAGIDFNPLPENPPVAITGPLNAPEGSSVICDRNGNMILSTDGYSIFDKLNNDITPAGGIGGQKTSTQSALIMPTPGDETRYYIFTTEEIPGTGSFELRYSIFDRMLNNGLGGLAQHNQLLFAKSTERITGNANWLIAHEFGNNSFRAYPTSKQGLGNPVISSVGSDHSISVVQNGQGYMKLGARNRIAVALSTPGVSNKVEVFDFDNLTGRVTNFRSRDLQNSSGQVYGIEISPGGNKLFATVREGVNSRIYELVLHLSGGINFLQSPILPGDLGAIQNAPDGQIYVAMDGSINLGVFSAIEDTTMTSPLSPLQPIALSPATSSAMGLPNLFHNPAAIPGLGVDGLCLGDSSRFFANGNDASIDRFDWIFGDGQSAVHGGAAINHLYAAPGTYNVIVAVSNRCESPEPFIKEITITGAPPDPSQSVSLCTGPVLFDANPDNLPGLAYAWETSETTRTITADMQGVYNITITDDLGCSTDASFLAADNRPMIELGQDQTVCQGTPILSLDAENPGAIFSWTVNGSSNGNTSQQQTVDTSLPGMFEYAVLATDPITNCFKSDNVIYSVGELPEFTVASNGPMACNSNTGQITINITAPANSLFNYLITGPSGPLSDTDQAAGASITTPQTLAPGTYSVTVSDQGSACETVTAINISTDSPKPVITREGTILTSTSDTGNQWLKNNLEIEGATEKTYSADEPGSYSVAVDAGGCFSISEPIIITNDDVMPSISSFSPASGPTGTIVTIAGINFSDAPGNNEIRFNGIPAMVTMSSPNEIATTVPSGASTGPITVTVAGRTAISVDNFTVCSIPPKPTITAEGGLLTSSSDTGNQWFQNGTEIAGATDQAYTAADPGSYTVLITVNGCSSLSDPTTITGMEGTISSLLRIFPNPTGGSVTIELDSFSPGATAELFTLTGMKKENILLSIEDGRMVGEIEMISYPTGMYLLMIHTVKGNKITKLVKL